MNPSDIKPPYFDILEDRVKKTREKAMEQNLEINEIAAPEIPMGEESQIYGIKITSLELKRLDTKLRLAGFKIEKL